MKDKLEHYEYLIQDANESLRLEMWQMLEICCNCFHICSKLGPKEDTSAVVGPDSSMLGAALSRSEVVYNI